MAQFPQNFNVGGATPATGISADQQQSLAQGGSQIQQSQVNYSSQQISGQTTPGQYSSFQQNPQYTQAAYGQNPAAGQYAPHSYYQFPSQAQNFVVGQQNYGMTSNYPDPTQNPGGLGNQAYYPVQSYGAQQYTNQIGPGGQYGMSVALPQQFQQNVNLSGKEDDDNESGSDESGSEDEDQDEVIQKGKQIQSGNESDENEEDEENDDEEENEEPQASKGFFNTIKSLIPSIPGLGTSGTSSKSATSSKGKAKGKGAPKSDDDDEDSGKGKTPKKSTPSKKKGKSAPKSEDDNDAGNKTQPKKSSSPKKAVVPARSSTKANQEPYLKSPKELAALGKMAKVPSDDPVYKIISRYAKNSCNVVDSGGEIKIHRIVRFDCKKSSKSGSNQTLLWFKTTPVSVDKLAEKDDGAVAFYDRLSRALAVKPEDLTEPLKQTILLCSVSLGKIHTNPYGYGHWATKQFPDGYNSVKAAGKFSPDEKGNKMEDDVQVPCGKTIVQGKCNLDYSVYIVKEAKRIKVKYAVDLEIIPGEDEEEEEEEESENESESE